MIKMMLIGLDSASLTIMEHFSAHCPTIQNQMKLGVSGRAMPGLPVYTPTNWANLCTGAIASVSGQEGWRKVVDGYEYHSFHSKTYNCETIFDACNKNGIYSLAVSYPGSYPVPGEYNMAILPLQRGLEGNILMQGRIIPVDAALSMSFTLPGAGEGMDVAVSDGANDTDNQDLNFTIVSAQAELILKDGGGELTVCYAGGSKSIFQIEPDAWSDTITIYMQAGDMSKKCGIRVNLFDDGKQLAISGLYDMDNIAAPLKLAQDIENQLGMPITEQSPFIAEMISLFKKGGECPAINKMAHKDVFENIDFIMNAARIAEKQQPYEVFYIHYHFLDNMLHHVLQAAEESAAYTKQQHRIAQDIVKLAIEACDYAVKKLLELTNKGTNVLIVSDHGHAPNKYGVNITNRLVETGLCVKKADGAVDKQKSKAWLSGLVSLWIDVNAERGSDEYIKIQEEAIDAMLDWKTPSGKRIVAAAFKRKDSHFLGYQGPRCGDVTLHLNTGFAWTATGDDVFCEDLKSSNHGPQMPVTFTKVSDNLAYFCLTGPQVNKNMRWDEEERGYIYLTDFVPTLCHFSGIPTPINATGAVRRELFV